MLKMVFIRRAESAMPHRQFKANGLPQGTFAAFILKTVDALWRVT